MVYYKLYNYFYYKLEITYPEVILIIIMFIFVESFIDVAFLCYKIQILRNREPS